MTQQISERRIIVSKLTSSQLCVAASTAAELAIDAIDSDNAEFARMILIRLQAQLQDYIGGSDPRDPQRIRRFDN